MHNTTPEDIEWILRHQYPALTSDEFEHLNKISGNIVNYKPVGVNESYVKRFVQNVVVDQGDRIKYKRGMSHVESLECFPPLCESDLAVLRVRLVDILREVNDSVLDVISNLDYVTAANVALYSLVFPEVFELLSKLGVFSSRQSLINFGKNITPSIKRIECSENDRQPFAEINSLAGYQQAEPADWDMKAEVENLAYAGIDIGLIGSDSDNDFKNALRMCAPKVRTIPDYISFLDYVKSGKWMTSGSSSLGKVNWEFGEHNGTFKCRKNMVLAYYTAEELVSIALEGERGIDCVAFVKPELAKRRIAIACDIKAYLIDNYVLAMCGSHYKQYVGVTLEESPNEQQKRIESTVSDLEYTWAMPFDFAGFDTQPQEVKVEACLNELARDVDERVKPFVDIMLKNYKNIKISYMVKGDKFTVKTTGGVPSGVNTTSIIGTEYNITLMMMAKIITERILNHRGSIKFNSQGDDAQIFAKNASVLVLFRLVLAGINAVGHNSKFGISKGHVEFLRNHLTKQQQRGWSCRTIPSIIQRKPWNSEPWKPAGDTETLFSRLGALERRCGFKLPKLESIIKRRFSRITHLDTKWLSVPKRAGGLGLLTDRGWRASEALPNLTRLPFKVSGTIPYPLPDWLDGNCDPVLFSTSLVSNLISYDDVPGSGSVMRRQFANKLSKLKVIWHKIVIPDIKFRPLDLNLSSRRKNKTYPDLSSSLTKSNFLEFISEYEVARHITELPSLTKLLQKYFPGIHNFVKSYSRRGWHMTDAINILLGSTPLEPMNKIHPLLVSFAQTFVWSNYRPQHWFGRQSIATKLSKVSSLTERAILGSNLFSYYLY